MEIEVIFGQVLKEFRTESNLSQYELADLAELDRTYISLMERGLRQPTISTLFKIANALNVKPSSIITKVENTL